MFQHQHSANLPDSSLYGGKSARGHRIRGWMYGVKSFINTEGGQRGRSGDRSLSPSLFASLIMLQFPHICRPYSGWNELNPCLTLPLSCRRETFEDFQCELAIFSLHCLLLWSLLHMNPPTPIRHFILSQQTWSGLDDQSQPGLSCVRPHVFIACNIWSVCCRNQSYRCSLVILREPLYLMFKLDYLVT